MIIWADGTVTSVRAQWKGAVELAVARRNGNETTEVLALAYTDLMAAPAIGDRVLLNVAASVVVTTCSLQAPQTSACAINARRALVARRPAVKAASISAVGQSVLSGLARLRDR